MMPIDMAMRICLASSPPLRTLFSNYDNCSLAPSLFPRCQALRPCLASGDATCNHGYDVSGPPVGRACRPKKRVVFADARGLALADIIVFKEEDPLTELQFHLSDVEGDLHRLRLGDAGSSVLRAPGM